MTRANQEIRQAAKENGVFLYELAERLHINDGNLSRRLRKELSQSEKQQILKLIEELAEKQEAAERAKG